MKLNSPEPLREPVARFDWTDRRRQASGANCTLTRRRRSAAFLLTEFGDPLTVAACDLLQNKKPQGLSAACGVQVKVSLLLRPRHA